MHKKNLQHLKYMHIKAFSFVEIGIVLMVIGILIGGVFKGKDLIDVAKGHALSGEIHKILHAVSSYHDQYQALPGDDPSANRFGSAVKNGNGNHIIDGDEASLFWIHLNKAGFMEAQEPPSTKFGGVYSVSSDEQNTLWLTLALKNGDGILTPKQAQKLKSTLQRNEAESSFIIQNGKNQNTCLKSDGTLDLLIDEASCVFKIKMRF
ncbi:MAG: hypothetical protein HEEMFOPI_00322 [Holosporales bacterium]